MVHVFFDFCGDGRRRSVIVMFRQDCQALAQCNAWPRHSMPEALGFELPLLLHFFGSSRSRFARLSPH